jgi:hypothetical protein
MTLAVPLIVLSFMSLAAGAPVPAAEVCVVAVSSPAEGDAVPHRGQVTGTATIPTDRHLWVFTQREGAGTWWLFAPKEVPGSPGSWFADVTYGDQDDVGAPVRLWVWAVDNDRHDNLLIQEGLKVAIPVTETPESQDCDDERRLTRQP